MAKWEEHLPQSLLKPQLLTCVKDGERFRALFQKCGGDGSKNVFLLSTADRNGLSHFETENLEM